MEGYLLTASGVERSVRAAPRVEPRPREERDFRSLRLFVTARRFYAGLGYFKVTYAGFSPWRHEDLSGWGVRCEKSWRRCGTYVWEKFLNHVNCFLLE